MVINTAIGGHGKSLTVRLQTSIRTLVMFNKSCVHGKGFLLVPLHRNVDILVRSYLWKHSLEFVDPVRGRICYGTLPAVRSQICLEDVAGLKTFTRRSNRTVDSETVNQNSRVDKIVLDGKRAWSTIRQSDGRRTSKRVQRNISIYPATVHSTWINGMDHWDVQGLYGLVLQTVAWFGMEGRTKPEQNLSISF